MRVLILVNSCKNLEHLLGEKKTKLYVNQKELEKIKDSDSKARIIFYSEEEVKGPWMLLSKTVQKGIPKTKKEAIDSKLSLYYDKILSYPQNNKEIQIILDKIIKEKKLITTYAY